MRIGSKGTLQITVPMNSNDVVLVSLRHVRKSR